MEKTLKSQDVSEIILFFSLKCYFLLHFKRILLGVLLLFSQPQSLNNSKRRFLEM